MEKITKILKPKYSGFTPSQNEKIGDPCRVCGRPLSKPVFEGSEILEGMLEGNLVERHGEAGIMHVCLHCEGCNLPDISCPCELMPGAPIFQVLIVIRDRQLGHEYKGPLSETETFEEAAKCVEKILQHGAFLEK